MSQIVIYQEKENSCQMAIRLEGKTIWLREEQIAKLFGCHDTTIVHHLNIIDKQSACYTANPCKKITLISQEEDSIVCLDADYYDLNTIIEVGYRINTKRARQFRQWATRVLGEYLIHGSAISPQRIHKNTSSSQ